MTVNAKQAFVAVREAQQRVNDRVLTLSQISELRKETLGWDSPVTQFRKYADEQIKVLPRGDKQKKILRSQKADLSKMVNALRDSMSSYEDLIRMKRAEARDNKSAVRFEKARIQIVDAVRRMIEEDRANAYSFLLTQLERAEATQTADAVDTDAESVTDEEHVTITD